MSLRLLIRDHPVRAFAVATETHALVLRHNASSNAHEHNYGSFHSQPSVTKCLVEFSGHVKLSDYRVLRASGIHGILGLINLGQEIFICVISSEVRVATIRPHETVQRILSVDFYCLSSRNYDLEHDQDFDPYAVDALDSNTHFHSNHSEEVAALQHPCYELKKMLGSGTFYYSSIDITRRLQDRLSEGSAFDLNTLDEDYLWNKYMIDPLIKFRASLAEHEKRSLDNSGILTSAIRGFALTITIPSSASPFKDLKGSLPSTLSLISRLSCRRAGTRFNSRGIDDDGNVANFVETETIFWHPHGLCFSYVQVRGSVPLFWEQATGILPGQQKIQVIGSVEAAQPAFDKHFEALDCRYGQVNILNLLSESKPGEAELTARYKGHVHRNPMNQRSELDVPPRKHLAHIQYDFHAETKSGGYQAAAMIRQLVQNQAKNLMFFLCEATQPSGDISQSKPRVLVRQRGVFRVNCLDCLDRTNLIETILSSMALDILLEHFADGEAVSNFWTSSHASIWADNGDALSKIYAGTGALKSSFTRHGKMSLAGAIADARKSATRLYVNNFADKGKQNTIDMLLGRLMDQSQVHLYDPVTDHVASELKRRADEYSTPDNINIWVGTFNLNGKGGGTQQNLTPWLCPQFIQNSDQPAIVAVAFQELVELSPQQIMSTDPARLQAWEVAVEKTLNRNVPEGEREQYVLLRSGQLVGAALIIFVVTDALNMIKNVEGSVRKTGMSGMAGNKGAVAIRMDYANTRLCFVTAHLAAGFANFEERNRDYWTINNGLRFQRNRSIEDHDTIIWAGDFNYRIGLNDEKVRSLAWGGDLDALYGNDQLNLQMMAGRAFPFYSESRITFPPTYKYNNGTDEYDTSEKARIPAWCDRVLRKGDNLKQLIYTTAPLRFSDHRPVYATFRCTIRVVNQAKKEELGRSIYFQRQTEIGLAANTEDGDLLGYDSIDPELPPASSDRRKWWLDNGLPARSGLEAPNEKSILNDQRPHNPFSLNNEPEWLLVPQATTNRNCVNGAQFSSPPEPGTSSSARERLHKSQSRAHPALGMHSPRSRGSPTPHQYMPSIDPLNVRRKPAPAVPNKPDELSENPGMRIVADVNSKRSDGQVLVPKRTDRRADPSARRSPTRQRSSQQIRQPTQQQSEKSSETSVTDNERPPLPFRRVSTTSANSNKFKGLMDDEDDDDKDAKAIPSLQPIRRQ